jgi:hypothetical protein
MTSSPHGPYAWGCTRTTMGRTERCQAARPSESQKPPPSSDRGLQPARVKPESLVIADQHAAVNVFLSLVHTARQATKAGSVRSRRGRKAGAEDETRDGD